MRVFFDGHADGSLPTEARAALLARPTVELTIGGASARRALFGLLVSYTASSALFAPLVLCC